MVPKLWRACIIGNDFIQKHNLQIDGGRQQVYFKNMATEKEITPNLGTTERKEEQYILVSNERVKIPQGSQRPDFSSEKIIQIGRPPPAKNQDAVIPEYPHTTPPKSKYNRTRN